MPLIHDYQLMIAQGLRSPYIRSTYTASPISGQNVLTHTGFPGLSGLITLDEGEVAVIYVEELPVEGALSGTLQLRSKQEIEGEEDNWIINVESSSCSWEFSVGSGSPRFPCDRIVLCQWKPGALEQAFRLHHEMVKASTEGSTAWLIGSDLEKEAYTEYAIAAGLSTLAHPLEWLGLISKAAKSPNSRFLIEVAPEYEDIPCLALQGYPITWRARPIES